MLERWEEEVGRWNSSSPVGWCRVSKPCFSMHRSWVIAKPCLAMNWGVLSKVVDSQVCACMAPVVCNQWGNVIAYALYVRCLDFCVTKVVVDVGIPIIVIALDAYD